MKYIAYECMNCGHEVVVRKEQSGKMDGRACEKCFGGPFKIYPTDRPPAPAVPRGKKMGSLMIDCKADTKELDEAIKKAEYLLELLERIETQTQHWNEHILSEYMKIKI